MIAVFFGGWHFMRMVSEKAFYIEGHRVQVKRHPKSRSLKLRMDPLRKIPVLTAPTHCKHDIIERFLLQSREWWISQVSNVETSQLMTSVPILGRSYEVFHKVALKRVQIDHEAQEIIISRPFTDPRPYLYPELIKLALPLFEEHTRVYAQQLNVSYTDMSLRDYRARWGTCKQDKRIVYSWRLIMAPLEVLKYVCAHEVAHLLHFNHSPEFWAAVRFLMPDYKVHKSWLKQNGQSLFQAF